MRILLVEDDPMIGQVLSDQLTEAAYAVDWVRDGHLALAQFIAGEYAAVLLDLGLPGRDGLDVLRRIRAEDTTPVIVLTARGRLGERITGLDAGADDYLVKPFAFEELSARLRAVVRRAGELPATTVVAAGRLRLDPAGHSAQVGDGEAIPLTRREFAVLRALLSRPGVVLSRDELEYRVYGAGDEVESNAIEFTIHRLRAKLGAEAIRNVRGIGWLVPKAT